MNLVFQPESLEDISILKPKCLAGMRHWNPSAESLYISAYLNNSSYQLNSITRSVHGTERNPPEVLHKAKRRRNWYNRPNAGASTKTKKPAPSELSRNSSICAKWKLTGESNGQLIRYRHKAGPSITDTKLRHMSRLNLTSPMGLVGITGIRPASQRRKLSKPKPRTIKRNSVIYPTQINQ